jgi:hypothetical protein
MQNIFYIVLIFAILGLLWFLNRRYDFLGRIMPKKTVLDEKHDKEKENLDKKHDEEKNDLDVKHTTEKNDLKNKQMAEKNAVSS